MAEYIITQEDLDKGNSYLKTLTTEHPVCRIADGVSGIPNSAFFDCSGLTSITIPSSVTSIGNNAFNGCTSLTTIYVSEDFDTTLLDGKVPEGATIEVKHVEEELVTLSQLKAYDEEKTNIWHNSFTTNNLTVDNANVTNLAVNSAAIDNANVTNLAVDNAVINNSTVVNGTITDLKVTNLVADNMSSNNLKVGNFIANKTGTFVEDLTVNNSTVVNGNVFTHMGFDVASTKVILEDRYNKLGAAARNDAFYITGPNGNMYFMGAKWTPSYVPSYLIAYVQLPNMANNMQALTTSTLTFTSGAVTNSFVNGGAYSGIYNKTPFGGIADMSSPVGTQANDGSIITNANELYIHDASNMYKLCYNLTDTFICNPSLITNAPSDYDPMKYCENMSNMFTNCYVFNQPVRIPNWVKNMSWTFSDCHKFNQPVRISDGVTSMWATFYNCYKFNQPVNIPNGVTSMTQMFFHCYNFNQPVNIPGSVEYMTRTFEYCHNFNQPVNISDGVGNMVGTFRYCDNFNQPVNIPDSVINIDDTLSECYNFNQPVTIGNNVKNMKGALFNCHNFNQPVNIPDGVRNMAQMFVGCTTLRNSTVPIHISHTIALGNKRNYIYNCLVNGITGVTFAPSRILNDL